MKYISNYDSPLGNILICADEIGLVGLLIEGQKYFADKLDSQYENGENEVIKKAKKWLDTYFSFEKPKEKIKFHLIGTKFQIKVWNILNKVPYGQTITYGDIANILAKEMKIKKMSARAVGLAVGRNPISIIIPCHRVIGKNGNLTGYAGGIDKKIELLKIENIFKESYYIPKNYDSKSGG